MLGSFFDLKREVARIAAKRAAAEASARAEEKAARAEDKASTHFSDFDGRLQDFIRSFRADDAADTARPGQGRHEQSGSH